MKTAVSHLSDEEVALYAEGIALKLVDELPVEMLEHVMDCLECKKKLIEIAGLSDMTGIPPIRSDHPFFGRRTEGE